MALRLAFISGLSVLLVGCISLGPDLPDSLLTLTAERVAATGPGGEGSIDSALAVLTPAAAQKLAVPRVPVQVSPSTLAYLPDAVWVERPAELFRRLLAETIRAGGQRMVVEGVELEDAARTTLTGQLLDMGYDVPSASVIVRYDAVLQTSDGRIRMQRFEASERVSAAEVALVGPALNRAANVVAGQVADWVGSQ